MTEIKIIRLKRWSSKTEREQNPDWRNPGALTQSELSTLSALLGRGVLHARDFERVDSAGTVMLIAQDSGDLIVGFLSMTLATLIGRNKAYIDEVLVDEKDNGYRYMLLKAAAAIRDELGIPQEDIPPARVQSVKPSRVSGVSMVKSVERIENSFDERPEPADDGPSTSQLRSPPRTGND